MQFNIFDAFRRSPKYWAVTCLPEERKKGRVILHSLIPKYINVTLLLVYFGNKLAQRLERHHCKYFCIRMPVLSALWISFGQRRYMYCHLLSNSGNEWVARVVYRPVGLPLSSVDELGILNFSWKREKSHRTIRPSLMHVASHSSVYIYI